MSRAAMVDGRILAKLAARGRLRPQPRPRHPLPERAPIRAVAEGGPDSRPLVDNIMITACGAAAVSPLDANGDGNGMNLCKKIAKHSGSYVTAANIIQIAELGQIDSCITSATTRD